MSVKISELPVLDSLADNDVLAGVDTSANTTSKVTLGSLKQYIDTNTQYTAGTNIDITNNVVSAPNVYNKTETDNLLSAKESLANKITSISSSSTNAQYPSAKSVYNHVSTTKTQIEETLGDVINETKGQLDGDIEQLDGDIEQLNNEIEELQSEIDSLSMIYNAFPTESGEGESLTLDDTAEVKFKKFNLKGNTSQVTYTGKNLLEITSDNYLKNCTYVSGANTNQYKLLCTASDMFVNNVSSAGVDYARNTHGNLIDCEYGETIYFDTGNSLFVKNFLNEFDSNYVSLGFYQKNASSGSYTPTNQNCKYVTFRFGYGTGATTGTTYTLAPIISKSSDLSYEPYTGGKPSPSPDYPQRVEVVSGDNSIKISSKNIFNKYAFVIKSGDAEYEVTDTGIKVYTNTTSSTTSNIYALFKIGTVEELDGKNLIASASVTNFSNKWGWYMGYCNSDGSNKITIVSKRTTAQTGTYTLSMQVDGTTYADKIVCLVLFGVDGYAPTSGDSAYFDNLQVEYGTTRSSYIPHNSDIYYINLPVENLFDKDNADILNGFITNTGAISSNASTRTLYIPCKPSTTYTISKISSARFIVGTTSSTPTLGGTTLEFQDFSTATKGSITTGSTASYLLVYYDNSGDTSTEEQIRSSIQIELGSKANSYTPFGIAPIKMCKIGNYQDEFIQTTGKNLWSSEWEQGSISDSNGRNGDSTNTIRTKGYIEVKPNQHYAIKRSIHTNYIQVRAYDKNKKFIGSGANVVGLVSGNTRANPMNKQDTCVIYPLEGVYYLRFTDLSNDLSTKYMMVEGDIPMEYEPYGVGKWYLHKEIGKAVLNGTQTLTKMEWAEPRFAIRTTISGIKQTTSASDSPIVLSDYYKPANQNDIFNTYNYSIGSRANQSQIIIRNDDMTSISDFSNWFTLHNTSVYYPLATPTNTEITYQSLIDQLNAIEKAMSKEGQTNISQFNNDKPFIINAEAILSLQNVLDRVTLLES